MCWSVPCGYALLGVTWTVALVCVSPMDLALEKRGVLSHGGFSLNDLMGEWHDVARYFSALWLLSLWFCFFKEWAFCCMMGILSDFIAVGGIDVAGFCFFAMVDVFLPLGGFISIYVG
ncbi:MULTISPECIES: hypothetical protein [unclassified Bartonella]|uniref:hypothetical protein n=1 Tax=unclassified Bartonella TaxID=2645622 RepID=UPI0035CF11F2